jgi:hypothetical protein
LPPPPAARDRIGQGIGGSPAPAASDPQIGFPACGWHGVPADEARAGAGLPGTAGGWKRGRGPSAFFRRHTRCSQQRAEAVGTRLLPRDPYYSHLGSCRGGIRLPRRGPAAATDARRVTRGHAPARGCTVCSIRKNADIHAGFSAPRHRRRFVRTSTARMDRKQPSDGAANRLGGGEPRIHKHVDTGAGCHRFGEGAETPGREARK